MKILHRNIHLDLRNDLGKKIVLLMGPRQAGKTTLTKSLTDNYQYLNYDILEQRELFRKKDWSREKQLIILDELHKMPKWKQWLKGIYDDEGASTPAIIVTGSAQMDIARKMGDSLAGRHFLYRLYPLDLKEIIQNKICSPDEAMNKILSVGSFPEPFIDGTTQFYNRWKRSHIDMILRQDLLDLENTTNIVKIENLIELLKTRVGKVVSRDSLAKALDVSPHTVKNWLTILENLFVIFSVQVWSTSVEKSLLKARKYYFFDIGQVDGDIGAKFENFIALSLLKQMHYQEDRGDGDLTLNFLRNKLEQEIDFAICDKRNPLLIVEAKWDDNTPDTNFKAFSKFKSKPEYVQLVGKYTQERDTSFNLKIRHATKWLQEFEIKT
jgi:predicted AAA+ superfamily ATPase